MLDVVILTIESELKNQDFTSLLSLVSIEKQNRIKKFHFFRDARNCLLGDVLSRTEICRATGFTNTQLKFSVNNYGKPFLLNRMNIHYNISHAGHYIACVISDEPVGIDIECIKDIDMKIAERFFAPDETAYIVAGDKTLRFYEVWTKKESHIKWEGKGLYVPLPSFSVLKPSMHHNTVYHNVFHDINATCHICTTKRDVSSVRFMGIRSLLQNIAL